MAGVDFTGDYWQSELANSESGAWPIAAARQEITKSYLSFENTTGLKVRPLDDAWMVFADKDGQVIATLPKEKAAACRALAKACRAWEPGVDMIWKNIEEEIRSGDPELFDKKVGRCLSVTTDRQRAAGCIDGDLPSHLGSNLESLATLMDLAAAAGETEVCSLFDS